MRRWWSHRYLLWFVFLLIAGSLPLLLNLSSPVLHTRPGGKNIHRSPDKVEVESADTPSAGLILSLMLKDSDPLDPKWRKPVPTVGSDEELQLRTQELRRHLLDDVCSKYMPGIFEDMVSRIHVDMVWTEDQFKLLYCEVPKAGCSNWKRVLMVLAGYAPSVMDIPHDVVHFQNRLPHLSAFNMTGVRERISTYTKVLFIRDPFERLVSAFRDKFENPNSYYHSVFGRAIISRYRPNATQRALRSGDGVTFREFVQYLLDPKRPVGMDIHWERVGVLCHPCRISYDFIGKFENMNSEANFLLQSIGAPPHVVFPDYKDRNPQDERTTFSIVRKYFSQLNATERQGVYDFYRMDYLMFNYSKPFPNLL